MSYRNSVDHANSKGPAHPNRASLSHAQHGYSGRDSLEREFSYGAGGIYRTSVTDYPEQYSPASSGSRERSYESPSRIEDATAKFEKGRIQVLQQEREHIQKKTFTKWCNSFLEKVGLMLI